MKVYFDIEKKNEDLPKGKCIAHDEIGWYYDYEDQTAEEVRADRVKSCRALVSDKNRNFAMRDNNGRKLI